jgi:hypothetical protein
MNSNHSQSTTTSTPVMDGGGNAGPETLAEINHGAQRVARELVDFLAPASNALPALTPPNDSDEATTDLQLAICRKLRELLPTNKELLHRAQQGHWIPVLLSWLNLHERPAVQVEALLALTNIAELCAQQSYFQTASQQTSAVAAAAQAAVSAVKGTTPSWNDAMEAANKYAPAKYPYQNLVAPAPGSVPFPPLSFSQTLSPEAVMAFDASLISTIQSSAANEPKDRTRNAAATWTMPPAPLFPNAPSLPGSMQGIAGGINFTSLAPPPGGAHSSVPSNSFLPPPTPVSMTASNATFPQQLSASSQHLLLRHADAIPTLIALLSSPSREVYEQAMWILGSIAAGDSPGTTANIDGKSVSARDVILAAGVMNQMLRCLESHPGNLSLQRIASWTLSNLVDGIFQQSHGGKSSGSNSNGIVGNPSNNSNNNINNTHNHAATAIIPGSITGVFKPNNSAGGNHGSGDYSSADEIEMITLLPVLRRLLRMSDAEVLSYTCWTLSHLCDGPSSHIAAVVTTPYDSGAPPGGLVPRLVDLLMHPSWRVTKPALRTIGNIVCAECSDDALSAGPTTDYTEVILECQAVPRLKELVTHSNREIQKEACWTLSNIAAGTVDQIQAVIDSGAIPPLVELVQNKKTDQEVRSEACWVVLNATSCGGDSQIEVLVDEGCVSVLGVLLTEASMVMMALEGLERVLQVEETRETMRRERIENGEIEDNEETRTPTLVSASLLEKALDNRSSTAVIKRADRIWKQHFVSCALCKQSFSKHRIADASFCEECKCHVCCNCNCRIYHLDYQEELWAATEEKTEAKKNAKKSKNKKKKEKFKQKKAKKQEEPDDKSLPPHEELDEPHELAMVGKEETKDRELSAATQSSSSLTVASTVPSKTGEVVEVDTTVMEDDDEDEEDAEHNQIDLVLYLQQTGSIIALAKLMDALEYGGDDYDEELDDYERKMLREQHVLRQQQSAHSAH